MMQSVNTPLVFGTYKLHGEILSDSLHQALALFQQQGRPLLVDTAAKYGNIATVAAVLQDFPGAVLGWKVDWRGVRGYGAKYDNPDDKIAHPSLLAELDKFLCALRDHSISIHRVFRILQHNYFGKEKYLQFQIAVDTVFGAGVMPIGICNITAEQLEELCNDKRARVNYVQNEYHPFLASSVPAVCVKYGISMEVHSIMTNLPEYEAVMNQVLASYIPGQSAESAESEAPSDAISLPFPQKSSQMAIAFASAALFETDILSEMTSSTGVNKTSQLSICVMTTNWIHLNEICSSNQISPSWTRAMRHMVSYMRIVRYRGADIPVNTDWVRSCNEEYIHQFILPQLIDDIRVFKEGGLPSSLCVQIPKHHRSNGEAHSMLSRMIYLESACVESQPSMTAEEQNRLDQKLASILVKMRRAVNANMEEQRRKRKTLTGCAIRAVTNPSALPMKKYPEAGAFADLNRFLLHGSYPVAEIVTRPNIRFQYGTLNSDGRYDMCKQGFRNAFVESAEAVALDGCATRTVANASALTTDMHPAAGDFTDLDDGIASTARPNIRFQYGTLNSDGRYDMCKQGFRNAFVESAEAVALDLTGASPRYSSESVVGGRGLIKHYLIGNNRLGEDDVDGTRVQALASLIHRRPDIVTWYLAGNELNALSIEPVAKALAVSQAKYVWFKMNPIKTGAYHLARAIQQNRHIELLDLFNCGVCDDGLEAFLNGLMEESQTGDNLSGLKHLYLSINFISDVHTLGKVLRVLGPQLESLYIGVNPIGDDGFQTLLTYLLQDVVDDGKVGQESVFKNLIRLNIGAANLTDASLLNIHRLVKSIPSLLSLDIGSYKSTKYFQQEPNRFTDGPGLVGIGQVLMSNALASTKDSKNHVFHLFNCFTGSDAELDSMLESMDGCSMNVRAVQQVHGMTHRGRDLGLPARELKDLSDPHPAVDFIKSIYRNTMKVED
jgi:hypothetical protein